MNRRNIITSTLALAAGLFVRPAKAVLTPPPKGSYWDRPRDEYAVFVEDLRKKYKGSAKLKNYTQRITLIHRSDANAIAAKRSGQVWRETKLDTYLDGPVFRDFKEHKSPGQEIVITLTDPKWAL